MEIILLLGYVPIVAYLFWQSYLLSQYKKIVKGKDEAIANLARKIDTLKPFQVFPSGSAAKHNRQVTIIKKRSSIPLNVSGVMYNRTMKKRRPPLNKIAQATRNAHSAELFRSLLLNKHIVATPATRKGSRKSNIQKAIKEYN